MSCIVKLNAMISLGSNLTNMGSFSALLIGRSERE